MGDRRVKNGKKTWQAVKVRVGKNIGQPADIKDNRGVTYTYTYIGPGHHVVLAGGQRCHRVATSVIHPP